ncbi:RNA polymerase sigma factor [Candidatus Roizmanbacteria bacterium]|nr:RNA polymerase sigma factor [Candidatus Roizmanbacteria bacterium]
METSDKEIIIKIKQGEIDYFTYLVKRYSSSIYRFIGLKIKKKEDIEDLVQNTFISFYRAIDKFNEEKPVKPYLYQIVQNELKMFYRRYKPIMPLKEEIIIEEVEAEPLDDRDLVALTGMEKRILILTGEGFTNEEIAKKFKKPLNTVKSIIRRARIKLKIKNEK